MVPPARAGSTGAPAFQAFYVAHRAAVLRLLVGMLGPEDAEDAFQEAFLKILRAWPPRLDAPERIDSWALTIAHRTGIDALRRRGREVVLDDLPEPAVDQPFDLAALDATPLWDAVRDLPPRQRASLVLRIVLDHSFAQAAIVLECSEEAARRSHADALAALRRRMDAGTLEVER